MDWKHALDLQHDTADYYRSDRGIEFGSAFYTSLFMGDGKSNPSAETVGRIYLQMLACLHQADTMFVTSDMLHLVMQAAHDLPRETGFDMKSLLSPRGFVLLEEKIVGLDRHQKPVVVNAFAWEKTLMRFAYQDGTVDDPKHGVNLYWFTDPYDFDDAVNCILTPEIIANGDSLPPLAISHYFPLIEGHSIESIFYGMDGEDGTRLVEEMLALFMALMYVSQQPIGKPIQLRPDRAARRRARREWNMNDPLITVITLRRKKVQKDDHEPGKVEWSRRWLVKGFWRRQWYPSLGIHQPVYIHDFIKGPEDKPFIPPSGRVFNFRR